MNTPIDKNIPIEDGAIPVNEIKALLNGLANDLNESLESGDTEKILAAQKTFSEAIDILWKMAQKSEIAPNSKAIFRLVVGWALEELPKQINNPVNHAEIKRQLKIFQKSMIMFN